MSADTGPAARLAYYARPHANDLLQHGWLAASGDEIGRERLLSRRILDQAIAVCDASRSAGTISALPFGQPHMCSPRERDGL